MISTSAYCFLFLVCTSAVDWPLFSLSQTVLDSGWSATHPLCVARVVWGTQTDCKTFYWLVLSTWAGHSVRGTDHACMSPVQNNLQWPDVRWQRLSRAACQRLYSRLTIYRLKTGFSYRGTSCTTFVLPFSACPLAVGVVQSDYSDAPTLRAVSRCR